VRAGTVTGETATVVRPVTHDRKSSRAWIVGAIVALVVIGNAVGYYVYRKRQAPQVVTETPTPSQSPVSQSTPAPVNEKVGQTATPEIKTATATQAKSNRRSPIR
jgi:hypothetical protein